jgi:outer membrane receptor protein involved in Fe transport
VEQGNPENDEFVDDRSVIDLQVDHTLLDQYTVTFGVENVTNERLRVYQGRSDRTAVVDVTGTQFWFGVRAQL